MTKNLLNKKRDCIKRNQNAFTLIELLIVIIIISVLAGIGLISYNGAQRMARDNQRKSDLQAIGTAYKMHYQDTKTWKFSNAELQEVVPGTTATGEGHGDGTWFNYESDPYSPISAAHALEKLEYMVKAPLDPSVKTASQGVTSTPTPPHQYIKTLCYNSGGTLQGILLLAQLERPSTPLVSNYSSDTNSDVFDCYGTGGTLLTSYWVTTGGMNYALFVK